MTLRLQRLGDRLNPGRASSVPRTIYAIPVSIKLSHRALRTVLIGLVIIPTILVWTAVISSLFGYQAVYAHGTSMEPTLQDGDALWMKQLDVSDIRAGDIITLGEPSDLITHRVVKIEPLSGGNYLILTKGDANLLTEAWTVNNDETIRIVTTRVPLGGYFLEFIASSYGKAALAAVTVTLIFILLRRRRVSSLLAVKALNAD